MSLTILRSLAELCRNIFAPLTVQCRLDVGTGGALIVAKTRFVADEMREFIHSNASWMKVSFKPALLPRHLLLRMRCRSPSDHSHGIESEHYTPVVCVCGHLLLARAMCSSRPVCKQACHLGNDPETGLPPPLYCAQAGWGTPDARGLLTCFLLRNTFMHLSRKAIRRQDHRQALHGSGVRQVSTHIHKNTPALQGKR